VARGDAREEVLRPEREQAVGVGRTGAAHRLAARRGAVGCRDERAVTVGLLDRLHQQDLPQVRFAHTGFCLFALRAKVS
jgi:hypothetical protein